MESAQPAVRDIAPAAQLLGASSAPAQVNVNVVGLIAHGKRGSAILSVDGKPAQAFPVGRELAPGLRLAEVHAKGVVLERNGARVDVAMPQPTAQPNAQASIRSSPGAPAPRSALPGVMGRNRGNAS